MAGKGERTRAALLAAAIERFGHDGYRGASVAEIARDARLSGTAAYAYFPSKEALFVAAVDEDTAAVMGALEGMLGGAPADWSDERFIDVVRTLEAHPLARRVLGGLEPDFTVRLAGIPALEQLRKGAAERIRAGQLDGTVRADADADLLAGGIVTIILSLLMSTVQIGTGLVAAVGPQVQAVFDAALSVPNSRQ